MITSLLIYGLINSVILALTALGFSLTYGISRIANFAHGTLYVIAGFAAWVFLTHLQVGYVLALAMAVVVTAALGALLYRLVLVRIRGVPLAEVIVTFALGIAILELMRYLGFFGASFGLPVLDPRTIDLIGIPVDFQRVLVVVVGGVVGIFLWLFSRRTRIGLALRAFAQDEEAAMMSGIDVDAVGTFSVALGAGLAGVAAVVVLPLGIIAAESGGNVLVMAIAVCIVGGLGSTLGVVIASLIIGYAQILSVFIFGPQYQVIVALLAILGTLIVRPSGLFGQQKALAERV